VYLIISHLSPELQQELFSNYPHAFQNNALILNIPVEHGIMFVFGVEMCCSGENWEWSASMPMLDMF
jgi:hypothetical protein